MATQENQPATFVELVARNRQTAGKILLAVGTLLIGLTLYLAYCEAGARSDDRGQPAKSKNPENVAGRSGKETGH